MSANPAVALQQVRKPYTITKQRERWTEEEHVKFVEALQLFGRGWRKIEEHIGTKTAVQIRSHAQKFFSKVERDKGSAGQHIEIPPPRPKRKPSHPYPKKAGLSSSDDTAAQCSQSCLEDNTPTQSVAKIGAKKGLKLFGATLLVDDPSFEEGSSPCREDESGVESGASDFQRTKCGSDPRLNHSEVSSRDRDQEFDQQNLKNRNLDQQSQQQSPQQSPQQSQQYQLQLSDQQIAMNNLIVLHYAAFLAAAHHPNQGGQVNPWQLLTPQQVLKPQHEILRWQSMTDSNSPGAVDNNNDNNINNVKNNNKIMNIINNIKNNDSNDDKTDTDDEVVEAAPPPRKRRRSNPVTEEKSSSSSTTTTSVFHGDDDSSQQACSRFSSMPEYSSPRGGFVPYKRPSAAINNNKRQDRR